MNSPLLRRRFSVQNLLYLNFRNPHHQCDLWDIHLSQFMEVVDGLGEEVLE